MEWHCHPVLILDALISNLAMILARFDIGPSNIESLDDWGHGHLKLNLDGCQNHLDLKLDGRQNHLDMILPSPSQIRYPATK